MKYAFCKILVLRYKCLRLIEKSFYLQRNWAVKSEPE